LSLVRHEQEELKENNQKENRSIGKIIGASMLGLLGLAGIGYASFFVINTGLLNLLAVSGIAAFAGITALGPVGIALIVGGILSAAIVGVCLGISKHLEKKAFEEQNLVPALETKKGAFEIREAPALLPDQTQTQEQLRPSVIDKAREEVAQPKVEKVDDKDDKEHDEHEKD
jgi:hypothetical protein